MNSIAWIFLAVVCYASGEVFLSDSSFADTKALDEKNTRQFWPFIPLNIPIPRPATPVAATPVAATPATIFVPVPVPAPARPVAATPLANCPAKCCKKYCKDGKTCTPGVPPITLPTCTSGALAADSGQCYSPETTGCAANVCKARATCQTNCGNVIDILDPAFCP